MMGRIMFFLLRVAFWFGVVCVLLPSGGATTHEANLDTAGAVSAATAAVSDMAGFCNRQPEACVVGGKVAVAIGQKAEAGAIVAVGLDQQPDSGAAAPLQQERWKLAHKWRKDWMSRRDPVASGASGARPSSS